MYDTFRLYRWTKTKMRLSRRTCTARYRYGRIPAVEGRPEKTWQSVSGICQPGVTLTSFLTTGNALNQAVGTLQRVDRPQAFVATATATTPSTSTSLTNVPPLAGTSYGRAPILSCLPLPRPDPIRQPVRHRLRKHALCCVRPPWTY